MPLIGLGVVMAVALLPAQQLALAWLHDRRHPTTPKEGTHA